MGEPIERAKAGDRAALDHIVADHYAAVYRFCARRIGPDLAEDAAQETFVAMQKSIRSYAGASSLSTWLFGIAANITKNLSRKNRAPVASIEDWMGAETPSPESGVIAGQDLKRALETLSEEHRVVVLMHEIEGLKYSEIAQILQIPEGTVKSRLHNAFKCLRAAMEGAE